MAVQRPVEASQTVDMGRYSVPYVSYGEPGEELPLILLHGISMPETHWGRLPQELEALGHHVIAVGLPKYKHPAAAVNLMRYGENLAESTRDFMSGSPFAGLNLVKRMTKYHPFMSTLGSYAEDQRPAIHELAGKGRYDLLGLSLGGLFAQQHALDDKENIHRLVLAGTLPAAAVPAVDTPDFKAIASVWSPSRSPDKAKAIYGGDIGDNPELLEELSEIIDRKIDPVHHANQLFAASYGMGTLITRRMWQRMLQDDSPETMVMAGTDDKVIPYNTARLAAQVLGLQVETIPEGGHGFLLSRAPAMAKLISKFLRAQEVLATA